MATKKGLYNSAQMTAQLPKEVKECFKVVGLNRKSSTRIMQFLRNSLTVISRKCTKEYNFLPSGKAG